MAQDNDSPTSKPKDTILLEPERLAAEAGLALPLDLVLKVAAINMQLLNDIAVAPDPVYEAWAAIPARERKQITAVIKTARTLATAIDQCDFPIEHYLDANDLLLAADTQDIRRLADELQRLLESRPLHSRGRPATPQFVFEYLAALEAVFNEATADMPTGRRPSFERFAEACWAILPRHTHKAIPSITGALKTMRHNRPENNPSD